MWERGDSTGPYLAQQLGTNPRLLGQLRTARDWGVPLSTIRGTGDGVWSDVDRLLAEALTMYEAALCDGCGQPLHESTSPDADPDNRSSSMRYEVPPPMRCFACTALDSAVKPYTGDKVQAPTALHFHATRTRRE